VAISFAPGKDNAMLHTCDGYGYGLCNNKVSGVIRQYFWVFLSGKDVISCCCLGFYSFIAVKLYFDFQFSQNIKGYRFSFNIILAEIPSFRHKEKPEQL
jgi:hypothetical protein